MKFKTPSLKMFLNKNVWHKPKTISKKSSLMYRMMSLLYMITVLLLLYIVLLNIHDDTFLFN